MRGATRFIISPRFLFVSFNPRPSCEGRRMIEFEEGNHPLFQSTPLMRGATEVVTQTLEPLEFQSTPLMRGATIYQVSEEYQLMVSIHAPHARGDLSRTQLSPVFSCFNPRPSCEGRLPWTALSVSAIRFQSTPLMRGATSLITLSASSWLFQYTPLMRGATGNALKTCICRRVSIHAPHARGDLT